MRNKTLYLLFGVLVGAMLFSGCSKEGSKEIAKKPADPDKVAVKVNSTPITEGMIANEMKKVGGQHTNNPEALKSAEMRKAIIENLVGETLILQGARKEGIEVSDEEVDKKISFIREQLGAEGYAQKLKSENLDEPTLKIAIKDRMIKQLFLDSLVPQDTVTEDAAKKIYTESPTPYIHPAQLNLRFIQMDSFDRANAVLKNIKAKSFDIVATDMEASGEGMVSGYGWTSPNMYSKSISDGLTTLSAGDLGGPYEGKQGYFIFHVKEKKPERPKTFDEVKGQIMQELYQEKKKVALAHWLGKERGAASIVQE